MLYVDEYKKWLDSSIVDEKTKRELKEIENNDKEIEERFYKDLEFGTAGLRGVMGAGTNRMNVYTVRKATQGLAGFVISQGEEAVKKGVAISRENYNLVYTAPLEEGMTLEKIYTRFNINHPKDFKGHSLSVSDIVMLHKNGENSCHYVDSFGYKDVPEFVHEAIEKLQKEQTSAIG